MGEITNGVNHGDSIASLPVESLPPLVAVVGRANVGKSTVFNRLARERRALVEDRPGVTRDRVTCRVRIEQREALLVDTGGLDPDAEEGLPAAVRRQARRAIRDASVILLVADVRDGVVPLDREIARLLRRAERPVILVVNKVDSPAQDAAVAEFHALGFAHVVPVSAEHNRGFEDLRILIARTLPPGPSVVPVEEEEVVRVAIVGRPNVGKSSLVNRLAGKEHAIVSATPGTTRDATDLRVQVDKRPVILTDTAGLRRAGRRADRLERGSAWMALRSIERAHVAVLLIDATDGVTEQDARIARIALERGRPLLLAVNKWDRVETPRRARAIEQEIARRLRFVPRPALLRLSALTGSGVGALLPLALELLEQATPKISTAEINRAVQDALRERPPPLQGRRRLRLYYATQVSRLPLTILAFVNEPELAPEQYRRYLIGFLEKRFGVRSSRIRLHLRSRAEGEGSS